MFTDQLSAMFARPEVQNAMQSRIMSMLTGPSQEQKQRDALAAALSGAGDALMNSTGSQFGAIAQGIGAGADAYGKTIRQGGPDPKDVLKIIDDMANAGKAQDTAKYRDEIIGAKLEANKIRQEENANRLRTALDRIEQLSRANDIRESGNQSLGAYRMGMLDATRGRDETRARQGDRRLDMQEKQGNRRLDLQAARDEARKIVGSADGDSVTRQQNVQLRLAELERSLMKQESDEMANAITDQEQQAVRDKYQAFRDEVRRNVSITGGQSSAPAKTSANTKEAPARPTSAKDLEGLPAGSFYVNPTDGKLYRKN